MIPAYVLYRYMSKKKRAESDLQMDSVFCTGESSSLVRRAIDREVFTLSGVSAKHIVEGADASDEVFIDGQLFLREKAEGVILEWMPLEEDESWEVTSNGESDSVLPKFNAANVSQQEINRLKFSVDLKDLQSFYDYEPKEGIGCIRFTCKDGSSLTPLYFPRDGGKSSFIDCLQRYATLKRSVKNSHLILFTEENVEALGQSFSILNVDKDILSRVISDPYTTAMTSLSKVASFVQDKVFPMILDLDAVSVEEQAKALAELTSGDEHIRSFSDDAGFEMITQLELPRRPEFFRDRPVTEEIWRKHQLPDGSFKDVDNLRSLVFRGGLEPGLRKEAWKYLLGMLDWKISTSEHNSLNLQRKKTYERIKGQWSTIDDDQESRFSLYAQRKSLIEKDADRTDRTNTFYGGQDNVNIQLVNDILMTYCMYNFDLGYVQGMSDYLSPLLVVFKEEVETFWAFVKLMERVHDNFEMDQKHILRQLRDIRDLLMIVNPKLTNYLESHQSDHMYFCFRWVLVTFKREFSFEDTMRIWEVLWTGHPCKNFHLLMCVAVLDKQMNSIIENKFGVTEILKYVNDLSMHLDVDEVLTSAEAIFHQLAAVQDKLPPHIREMLALGEPSSSF